MHDQPVLLIAAHGTASPTGTATTRALLDAVRAAHRELTVELCFLDVARPSLAEVLDTLGPRPTIVVPLQLTAGYHVLTDIPAIVSERASVRVAGHLGPDPLLLRAVADRLTEAVKARPPAASIALVGVASSRDSARAEFAAAAGLLAEMLGRRVEALPIDDDLAVRLRDLPRPVGVATYLLAEGTFADAVRQAAAGVARMGLPVGVHPALIQLIINRYATAISDNADEPTREVR